MVEPGCSLLRFGRKPVKESTSMPTGKLAIDSINQLDRPVVVAYLMITACVFVGINLLVDLAYALLDPRARRASV